MYEIGFALYCVCVGVCVLSIENEFFAVFEIQTHCKSEIIVKRFNKLCNFHLERAFFRIKIHTVNEECRRIPHLFSFFIKVIRKFMLYRY